MDGMETTKILREQGYEKPIVVLTANAVIGQKEVFLANGFDDFISKPIDLRELDTILNKHIRDKHKVQQTETKVAEPVETVVENKPEETPTEPQVDLSPVEQLKLINVKGLDVAKGVEWYQDNEASYLKLIKAYVVNIVEKLKSVEVVTMDTLPDYNIRIHGIKGVNLFVFAEELGQQAQKLEEAAIKGDLDFIHKNNPIFLEASYQFIDDLKAELAKI
jgi:CheY-like chemotaxis protein